MYMPPFDAPALARRTKFRRCRDVCAGVIAFAISLAVATVSLRSMIVDGDAAADDVLTFIGAGFGLAVSGIFSYDAYTDRMRAATEFMLHFLSIQQEALKKTTDNTDRLIDVVMKDRAERLKERADERAERAEERAERAEERAEREKERAEDRVMIGDLCRDIRLLLETVRTVLPPDTGNR